jgi:glycosyltransferase involved in cell wall biosynthesis
MGLHWDRDRLRVLVAHNYYRQPGGEERVVETEVELLRERGHQVETYSVHNDEIKGWSPLGRAVHPIWNRAQYKRLATAVQRLQPDILHFHNFYAVLSPAAHHAARAGGAAVVQTLHNYRLGCVNGVLFRNGEPCERCLGKIFAWPGVMHRCYRDSHLASLSVAAMCSTHSMIRTWHRAVDRFIALTEFARERLVVAGLPGDRIMVKPNFTVAAEPRPDGARQGALFVGRLTEDKGIKVLLETWKSLAVPLRVIGDGPLRAAVAAASPPIIYSGALPPDRVRAAMRQAALLIMPSLWYETFGLVIIEAFAAGLPVIASRRGVMAELVEDGITGLLFQPNDPSDLLEKVRWALAHPDAMRRIGERGRAEYEARYTPERNYLRLIEIYDAALQSRFPVQESAAQRAGLSSTIAG